MKRSDLYESLTRQNFEEYQQQILHFKTKLSKLGSDFEDLKVETYVNKTPNLEKAQFLKDESETLLQEIQELKGYLESRDVVKPPKTIFQRVSEASILREEGRIRLMKSNYLQEKEKLKS